MPENDVIARDRPPDSPRWWIFEPEDHRLLAYVELDPDVHTMHVTLGDNTQLEIGSPEIAAALARCLLMATTRYQHIPTYQIRSNDPATRRTGTTPPL